MSLVGGDPGVPMSHRLKAHKNENIYKERIKRWYDKRLKKKEFKE
jgi:hypothetical protein